MSEIIQLYKDEKKTVKVYPKTVASEVYVDENTTVSSALEQNKNEIAVLIPKVNSSISGSPKGTFLTLEALKNDTNANTVEGKKNIYVVNEDGGWYYWNGSAWTKGGIYQSSGLPSNVVTYSDFAVSTNLLVLDTFNRSDSSTSLGNTDTGQAWKVLNGVLGIISNQGYCISSAGVGIAVIDSNTPNVEVEGDFIYQSYIGLAIRVTDKDNMIFTRISSSGIGLYKTVNGSVTALKTNSFTPVIGKEYHIKIVAIENDISVYVDNVLLISATDSFNNTMTKHGFVIDDVNGSDKINNFTIKVSGNKNNNTKIKDTNIYPVTIGEAVYIEPDKTAIEKFKELESKIKSTDWAGKSFINFGDSISWQDGQPYSNSSYTANRGTIARGYQTILKENLGFASYNNQAISGRPMADGTANGVGTVTTGLSVSDFSPYSLCIIASGTNDFKLNVPLGSLGVIGDTGFNRNTFYGAYRTLIEYILSKKPTIRIVLFTPLQRDNDGYDVNHVNTSGHKLVDYVNAIKAIGEMYGIPVCDMYSNSGITKLTFGSYLMDGLHPHDIGYERMGGYATNFIENIGL